MEDRLDFWQRKILVWVERSVDNCFELIEPSNAPSWSASSSPSSSVRPNRVQDNEGKVIFKIDRPFSWVNSRVTVSVDDQVIGEARQIWHPWRRRYELFVKRDDGFDQFANIDTGFLGWDFYATDNDGKVMAAVNRNWAGFGRELFTDTGQVLVSLT